MIELLLIPADVEVPASLLAVEPDDRSTIEEAVGGWVQFVPAGPAYLIMDSEGGKKGLPPNYRATALWEAFFHAPVIDLICGPVLVAGAASTTGHITGCPAVVRRMCGVSGE